MSIEFNLPSSDPKEILRRTEANKSSPFHKLSRLPELCGRVFQHLFTYEEILNSPKKVIARLFELKGVSRSFNDFVGDFNIESEIHRLRDILLLEQNLDVMTGSFLSDETSREIGWIFVLLKKKNVVRYSSVFARVPLPQKKIDELKLRALTFGGFSDLSLTESEKTVLNWFLRSLQVKFHGCRDLKALNLFFKLSLASFSSTLTNAGLPAIEDENRFKEILSKITSLSILGPEKYFFVRYGDESTDFPGSLVGQIAGMFASPVDFERFSKTNINILALSETVNFSATDELRAVFTKNVHHYNLLHLILHHLFLKPDDPLFKISREAIFRLVPLHLNFEDDKGLVPHELVLAFIYVKYVIFNGYPDEFNGFDRIKLPKKFGNLETMREIGFFFSHIIGVDCDFSMFENTANEKLPSLLHTDFNEMVSYICSSAIYILEMLRIEMDADNLPYSVDEKDNVYTLICGTFYDRTRAGLSKFKNANQALIGPASVYDTNLADVINELLPQLDYAITEDRLKIDADTRIMQVLEKHGSDLVTYKPSESPDGQEVEHHLVAIGILNVWFDREFLCAYLTNCKENLTLFLECLFEFVCRSDALILFFTKKGTQACSTLKEKGSRDTPLIKQIIVALTGLKLTFEKEASKKFKSNLLEVALILDKIQKRKKEQDELTDAQIKEIVFAHEDPLKAVEDY